MAPPIHLSMPPAPQSRDGLGSMLTDEQFNRARRLALQVAGIELFERHREVLARRGRRLGLVDESELEKLLRAVDDGEAAATQRFLCLLTTKFTGFFRHAPHFDLAIRHARCAAERKGHARLWSAGAATGEEPYSAAIVAIEAFACEQPPVAILATDLDPLSLETARRGEYGDLALRGLEPPRRERFFAAGESRGRWIISSAVRRLVEFRALNLISKAWPVEGEFDVIFCRNVLMYLHSNYRRKVVERMTRLLALDGLLIIDPAEHLGEVDHLCMPVIAGAYSRRFPNAWDPDGTWKSTAIFERKNI